LTADDKDDIVDIIAMTTFTVYHSQCMLGNLAQHRKLRSLSANQIQVFYAKVKLMLCCFSYIAWLCGLLG